MSGCERLILGIGSPHGDDQIGWKVIDELSRQTLHAAKLIKLATPIELIDRLGDSAEIHVVDACVSIIQPCTAFRLGEPADRDALQRCPHHGTHDFGLLQTLRLAESLGKNIDHVTIWVAAGYRFDPMDQISEAAGVSVRACVDALNRELSQRERIDACQRKRIDACQRERIDA